MVAVRLLSLPLFALVLTACGAGEPPPPTLEEQAAAKCPKVHLDRLAGDWIVASGDPKTRMRIEQDGADYKAFWVGGDMRKRAMSVTRREKDLQLTEIATGRKKERVEAGQEALTRLYVEPKLKKCALEVFMGRVDAAGKEDVSPKAVEFLEFPSQEGVVFTYAPPDEPLFLGEAARKKKVADKQIAEAGEPSFEHEMGTVPVGMWSDAAADGDPSCSYEMELFFDHMPVEGAAPVPAGKVESGVRHWYHEWNAPYSGNHHFEIHRVRVCGEERTTLGIAGIEAVLM